MSLFNMIFMHTIRVLGWYRVRRTVTGRVGTHRVLQGHRGVTKGGREDFWDGDTSTHPGARPFDPSLYCNITLRTGQGGLDKTVTKENYPLSYGYDRRVDNTESLWYKMTGRGIKPLPRDPATGNYYGVGYYRGWDDYPFTVGVVGEG